MTRLRDPDLLRLMHFEGGECALSGTLNNLELHHIYPKAQGGDDRRENLVFLSRDVHRRITLNEREARRDLGAYLVFHRPDFLRYLEGKLGVEQAQAWMERRYLVDSIREAC